MENNWFTDKYIRVCRYSVFDINQNVVLNTQNKLIDI